MNTIEKFWDEMADTMDDIHNPDMEFCELHDEFIDMTIEPFHFEDCELGHHENIRNMTIDYDDGRGGDDLAYCLNCGEDL